MTRLSVHVAIYATYTMSALALQHVYWASHWTERLPLLPSLSLQLVGLLLGAAVVWLNLAVGGRGEALPGRRVLHGIAGLALVLALALPLVTARLVLDGFANSGDEFAFLWQARAYGEGRIWYEPPPLDAAFAALRTWIYDGRWVGQYPPGWPLLLGIGTALGVPAWAVNPLLGLLLALLLLLTLRRAAGLGVAVAVTSIFVLTPFFVLNAGSYFSHVATAGLVLAFVVLGQRYLETGAAWSAVICGMTLGAMGVVRPLNAVLLGLLLAAGLIWRRRRIERSDLLIVAAGLPFLAGLLIYQQIAMGHPLISTYAADHLSPQFRFRLNRWGVLLQIRQMEELLAWTAPGLGLLFLGALAVKLQRRRLAFYDLALPLFGLAYLVQGWDGGNRYGPRYYFDIFPLMMLTIGTAAATFGTPSPKLRQIALHVSLAIAIHAAAALPYLARLHATIVAERQDPYRLAADAALSNAVVIIESGAGAVSSMQPYDLNRNFPPLDAPVLYASGPAASPSAVRAKFPERDIWIYRRPPGAPSGELIPWP